MHEPVPSLAAVAEDHHNLSLAQDLRQLADEAKTLAQAELAYQKSRAAYAGTESRTIALLLVVAAVVAFFAMMAFIVGTVIALGPVIGPWGAMAVVTGLLLAIAIISAFNARARLKRMMAIIGTRN
ncbi:phage holin family protein [Novosphingobium panipatense]|uniref:phage holin family protein n=1 Tax=Novosphingobium TaxID=165696 RepID=UPI000CDA9B37|nr:phage holin family protein [Novosphingobium sp. HII-3]